MAANRLVLLAAVPLFLVLAVVVYLTVLFAANQHAAQVWVRHTYQVMEAERHLQEDVQTAEASQRGYLLTHDPVMLDSYHDFAARVPGDLKAFRALTTDNPLQQSRADRLEKLIAARFQALAVSSRLAPALIATPPAAMLQALERGRLQMNAVRAEVARGLAEETRLLDQRIAQQNQQQTLEIAFAIGAGLLVLAVLLFAAVLLVRNNVGLAAAEQARANEAAILRATLDNAREGVAYFTSRGELCVFNAQFFRLFDLPDDLAYRDAPIAALRAVHGRLEHVLSAPEAGEVAHELKRVSWPDRELDVYKAPVSTGGFLIGVMDVTGRVRAETMVRQSQKMEAIGHLTGGVAHDFNNLLQIVSANLDLAASSGPAQADPKLSQRLQGAMSAVARGARLTGQLLAFARRQALDPRSLNLGRVVGDMTDLLRRTLGEQIEVEAVIAGGLWNTLVDPNQVENAILNLAINARDAMPGGGKLTLEIGNAYLDDTYAAQHSEVTPGQYVMLAVSDTGCGMTGEVMARVFEPFFTTKPEGKGTGLGLAQAYGFVKQSGGHIKIYSEMGDGTTVKMYLPRTRRSEDADDSLDALPVLGGEECILVVEDDDGVRTAAVDMLDELGYRVLKADNAESALKILEQGAKVDLLFTDVVMPGPISTREFTRRAQEILPKLLVLYTSGYTQNAIVHNGKLDDDAFLLSKPYRKDELARKLRGVFGGTARGPLAAQVAPVDTAAPSRGKVLVVEDVMLIRMATVDMVEQIGFVAVEAGDGTEALAALERDPDIAILLTDLGLPGISGHQLVEEARRMRPGLKVIIASGYSVDKTASGQQAPDVGYLTKPFDLGQLRRALGL